MKPYEPPIFPPWHGPSPLIDTRARDVEVARWRMGVIAIFIASGFLWSGIFALLGWVVG